MLGGGSSGVPFNVGAGAVGFHYLWFYSFGSWGKISAGTMSCLLLQLQYSYMLIYLFFSLTEVFYILFMYIFFMFILVSKSLT